MTNLGQSWTIMDLWVMLLLVVAVWLYGDG